MPALHATQVTLLLALVFGYRAGIAEPQSTSAGHRHMLELLREVEARTPYEHIH